jgi:hypothetical protein
MIDGATFTKYNIDSMTKKDKLITTTEIKNNSQLEDRLAAIWYG